MSDWKMVSKRECGSCTKCCEGYLKTTIRGEEVYPGKPCFLLQIGKGCTDYPNRPQDPCREFDCEWLVNPDFPDFFKPLDSEVIVHTQNIEKIHYLRMSFAGKMPTDEMINFFVAYGEKHNINICWVDSDGEHWKGDILFEEAMSRRQKSE